MSTDSYTFEIEEAEGAADAETVVYVLGWSPNQDMVYGVYATKEAALAAEYKLREQKARIWGRSTSPDQLTTQVGWCMAVPLRTDGTLPDKPLLG